MPTRPIESSGRKVFVRPHKYSLRSSSLSHRQHGSSSLLLSLPHESLTHITCYLSPTALFALARTCRRLCEHVDDDNTWLRAFLAQFLGIGPEHELQHQHILLLKRTEYTWRKEFILRCTVKSRWERSRNPTVTHTPQVSSIDGVHLMSEHGLLTCSIQYGTVARSIPLNGKVMKGYIDASGTGMRIGNPNVEFTPDVSACAMISDGGTARVFWGKRSGEIALTVANRVMESRAAFKFTRCGLDQQHEGAVQQLVPDQASNTFLSAGADGRIKLWDSKTLQHIWSSEKQQRSLIVDPFIHITGGLEGGFVAGALKSGDILLCDLHDSVTHTDEHRVHSDRQIRISSLVCPMPGLQGNNPFPEQQIIKMWLYPTGNSTVSLFVQYTNHSQIYRVHANLQSHDIAITPFGDDSFGNVSIVEPVISGDNNMVIVGDLLGFISIYDTNVPLQSAVAPVHRFEAHTDGAVMAIAWTPTVFATGSARGSTVIWDSLTLEPVRYFTSPSSRPRPGHDWDAVSRIMIDKGLVVIVVGNRVLTWKVGLANGREHQLKRHKHANTKLSIATKGQERYEMRKDITESCEELEYERAHAKRIYGREREQRSTLDTLGLSELEAVEYVLILSREEEEARQRTVAVEGDFDGVPGTPASSQPGSTPSTPLSPGHSPPSQYSSGRQYPRVPPPISNEKVQVVSPFVPEPMEAGTSASPLRSLTIGSGQPSRMATRGLSTSSLDDFLAISSSASSTSSSKGGTPASSAWRTPLPKPLSHFASRTRVGLHSSDMSLLSADIVKHAGMTQATESDAEEDMDDDLKLAIALSLAEAQSKDDRV